MIMELILKGSEKSLKRFLETYRLWLKRNSIEIVENNETTEVQDISKMKVDQVVELINKAVSITDLEPYLSDERKGVIKALENKMAEFEQ